MANNQVENDKIYVEFESKSDSFSHAFGTEKIESQEITRIEVYIPAINDWLDVTHMSNFDQAAKDLIRTEGI